MQFFVIESQTRPFDASHTNEFLQLWPSVNLVTFSYNLNYVQKILMRKNLIKISLHFNCNKFHSKIKIPDKCKNLTHHMSTIVYHRRH